MSVSDGRPGGRSFKLVGGALLALLLVAIGFAVFVYVRMIRYERVAALHLPPETTAALRVDLEKVVLYEPFRKHLLPLVDELGNQAEASPRLTRLQRETKIELAVDVRELVLARGAGAGDWLLIAGGKFARGGVVPGVAKVLGEEGIEVRPSPDGRSLLLPGGSALGQADDGAIVIASSERLLGAALPPGDAHRRLGLDLEHPVAFAATAEPLRPIADHPATVAFAALRDVRRVEHVAAEVRLGDPLAGEARVQLDPGTDSRAAAARVEAMLSALRLLVRLSGSDLAGEARVLASARVTPEQGARVRIGFEWQREDVERAARSLAQAIRTGIRRTPAP